MKSLHQSTREIAATDSARRKRLGQYFTGPKLARLLALLARADTARTIVDPMGGTGDMLVACLEAGGGGEACASIEIDPLANELARNRFAHSALWEPTLLEGSAFDSRTIAALPNSSFDLVITNPPYVRYQSLSKAHEGDIRLPNAVEIRNNLLEVAGLVPNLDEKDRELFSRLIASYSGLSDLAVPSWLLCAMLTRVGGRLAMVVPEAWLSRDYAQIVQYLLLRWFRIHVVVEDAQAVWFPDALVKTTLLVAERIERRPSAFELGNERYLHVRLDGQAMTAQSVVGNLFPKDKDPETAFVNQLEELKASTDGYADALMSAEWIPLQQKADNLRRGSGKQYWLQVTDELEGRSPRRSGDHRSESSKTPRSSCPLAQPSCFSATDHVGPNGHFC